VTARFRLRTLLALAAAGVMAGGCAQKSQALYNYGTYSQSYYAYKQEPSEASALALQKSIEEAIANADKGTSGRVPPGMYANLGYLYLKAGNSSEAIASFDMEKKIYPEAAHFMDRMIKKVEAAEGEKGK
jgi:hypothetical protein